MTRLKIAALEWDAKHCNQDADNVRQVTKKINGGLMGSAGRPAFLE